jgi:hypothetical protein
MSEKPKSKKAQEFFYRDGPMRADADLHNEILADGDHAAAEAVSRKVSKRIGLTDAQIDRLMGKSTK